MVGVSGSFGGVKPAASRFQELCGLTAGGLDQLVTMSSLAEVRTLAVLANSSCDLRCSHCYYDAIPNGYKRAQPLSSQELTSLVHEAILHGIDRIGIIGKEPLLPGHAGAERTLNILQAALSYPAQPPRTSLVTHGLHLHAAADALSEVALTELHISFDGTERGAHEQVRGPNTFDRAVDALNMAQERGLAEQVVASFTLHPHNTSQVPRMFEWWQRHGVRAFTLSPYMPRRNGPPPLQLASLKKTLLEDLPEAAARVSTTQPLSLTVDIDLEVLYRHADAFSDLFSGSILINASGLPFLQARVGSVEISLRIHPPAPLGGMGAISHDGFYFDRHPIYWLQKDYERHCTADLRRTSLAAALAQHRLSNQAAVSRLAHSLLHTSHAQHKRPSDSAATSLAVLA